MCFFAGVLLFNDCSFVVCKNESFYIIGFSFVREWMRLFTFDLRVKLKFKAHSVENALSLSIWCGSKFVWVVMCDPVLHFTDFGWLFPSGCCFYMNVQFIVPQPMMLLLLACCCCYCFQFSLIVWAQSRKIL